MEYLENIPEDANEYGLNKLLVTRRLAIDFKHRDTEMFLRTPELLDNINTRELSIFRSNQLRSIFHIKRSIFRRANPQELSDELSTRDLTQMAEVSDVIYVDFEYILKGTEKIINLDMKKVTIYSTVADEIDMISFFIKHNIPSPGGIRKVKDINSLLDAKKISTFVIHQKTSHKDKLDLWLYNAHVFVMHGEIQESIGFKTNKEV